MNGKPIPNIAAAMLLSLALAGCSQTTADQAQEMAESAGPLDEQTCMQGVAQKSGNSALTVVRSVTSAGASTVVVQAADGGPLWKCTIFGGTLKDISSVSSLGG
jgi:hypothetical protein